jgi:hypothetical protein
MVVTSRMCRHDQTVHAHFKWTHSGSRDLVEYSNRFTGKPGSHTPACARDGRSLQDQRPRGRASSFDVGQNAEQVTIQ